MINMLKNKNNIPDKKNMYYISRYILLCFNPADYKEKYLVVINTKFFLLTKNVLGNIRSIEKKMAALICLLVLCMISFVVNHI